MSKVIESAKQIIITAKIGDGCIYAPSQRGTSTASYSSILKDYMLYKHDVLSKEFKCCDVKIRDNSAGYNKHGMIYYFQTLVNEYCAKVYTYDIYKIIDSLDYFGYLMYYFDDGSFHKCHNTMQLYCNTFTQEQADALSSKIFDLFGGKSPKVYIDKKKDGRQYPYLYIPLSTTKEIINCYEEFVKSRPLLHCMAYKLGLPSQTIESNKCNSLTGE